jgi:hypothetical protein
MLEHLVRKASVAVGEPVIGCPYPLSAFKDKYDHSCYRERSDEYQPFIHVICQTHPGLGQRRLPRRDRGAAAGVPGEAGHTAGGRAQRGRGRHPRGSPGR